MLSVQIYDQEKINKLYFFIKIKTKKSLIFIFLKIEIFSYNKKPKIYNRVEISIYKWTLYERKKNTHIYINLRVLNFWKVNWTFCLLLKLNWIQTNLIFLSTRFNFSWKEEKEIHFILSTRRSCRRRRPRQSSPGLSSTSHTLATHSRPSGDSRPGWIWPNGLDSSRDWPLATCCTADFCNTVWALRVPFVCSRSPPGRTLLESRAGVSSEKIGCFKITIKLTFGWSRLFKIFKYFLLELLDHGNRLDLGLENTAHWPQLTWQMIAPIDQAHTYPGSIEWHRFVSQSEADKLQGPVEYVESAYVCHRSLVVAV